MKKIAKKIYYILLIILVLDLGYSFYQHYHMPLYGDMSDIILPTPSTGYYHVLFDPFGLNVLLKNDVYANPNRFFAHWTTSEYFIITPLLLQQFVDPIESIYLSSAIAKIIIQILILYLLAVYISNTGNVFKLDLLIAAILITPLFQTSGFSRSIGIIDPSVIYTFFYALPLGLLLLYFRPFFKALYYHKKPTLNLVIKVLLVLFSVILTLNGPLVPGVVLIVCTLVLLNSWLKNYKQLIEQPGFKRVLSAVKNIPNYLLFYFIGIGVLSLYSLYIGQNNALNIDNAIPLAERYAKIPEGLYDLFFQKLGFPLLFLMIFINVILIQKFYPTKESNRLINFIRWVGVFFLLYIILLPLGGYRAYRPFVVRYDTMMPVTIGLIFIYGFTTFYLLKKIQKKYKRFYVLGIVIFSLLLTNADRFDKTEFECEKQALETIAQSTESIVALDCDCPVMEWNKLATYGESERNAVLFNYWNITSGVKLYYHRDLRSIRN